MAALRALDLTLQPPPKAAVGEGGVLRRGAHNLGHQPHLEWIQGTQGWIQGHRDRSRDMGIDSGTQGWIQGHRGGCRDKGVDSGTQG